MPIRENKFARRTRENDKKINTRDAPPTIDEQLVRLEEDIRRLKVEFDIYFNGGAKRPPYDTKGRVETLIKRLADDRSFTFAQRYHYNSLVARFTSFRELWRRTLQGREEGRDSLTIARSNLSHTAGAANEAGERRSSFVCADGHREVPTIKNLYDALVEAKKACGETTDELSFSHFHRMIAAKTDALKERFHCERVRFSIQVEDGRVSFKAKAES